MARNISDISLEDSIFNNFGGLATNNRNHILGNVDSDADMEMFTHSTYADTSVLADSLRYTTDKFTVFSLTVQSITSLLLC